MRATASKEKRKQDEAKYNKESIGVKTNMHKYSPIELCITDKNEKIPQKIAIKRN